MLYEECLMEESIDLTILLPEVHECNIKTNMTVVIHNGFLNLHRLQRWLQVYNITSLIQF